MENTQPASRGNAMIQMLDSYDSRALKQLRAPENLSAEDQSASVQLAIEILEALKHMKWDSDARERENESVTSDAKKTDDVFKLAVQFMEALATIQDAEGDLNDGQPSMWQNNKIIKRSLEALNQLGYRMKLETFEMLQQHEHDVPQPKVRRVEKSIEETPDQHKSPASNEELSSQVDAGLKEAQRMQQQARLAAKIAQRAAQRAARQSQQAVIRSSIALQNMKTGTFSRADLRGASNSKVARAAQEAQDQAYRDAALQKAEAVPGSDPGKRGR